MTLKTVQYVSPSVWAWRKGRIKSIEKAVDCVITLFPFEEDAYKHSNIRICYAGHPLAYRLDQDFDELIKGKQAKSIALLPGSRKSEISLLANDMIRAARELKRKDKSYQFYMPLSDERHLELIKEPMEGLITISFNNAQEVLSNCQMAIITSGTATLEAMLLRTPCVTLYKTGWLTYRIVKPLLSIDNFSLPNLLAGSKLIPELLQNDVSLDNIVGAIDEISLKGLEHYYKNFHLIHENLKAGSSETAAKEIFNLVN